MNATDRSVLARLISKLSANHELNEDAANETVTDFIPVFIAEQGQKPKEFKMTSALMQDFISQIHSRYGINFDEESVKENIASNAMFQNNYRRYSKMIAAEKRNDNARLGNELSRVLSVYTSTDKINELKIRYNSKLWHFDPTKALNKDPNNEKLQAEKVQYGQYLQGVKRANRLLKYLNNNRINTRIDVDELNNGKLSVYLPEHNNTKVTLMADDPREIGEVTTWNNTYIFNQNQSQTADLKDMPPESIVDTILNPTNTINGISLFFRREGQPQHSNVLVKDLKVPIFVSSLSGASKSIKEANQEKSVLEEYQDDNGNDDADNIKITQHDKMAEIQARYRDVHYREIRTPEDIKAEHENHGLYATIVQQAKLLGLKDVRVFKNDHNVYKFNYMIESPDKKYSDFKRHNFGIIGGYIPPEKDGSNKLVVNGKLRGYSVPGMRGYIDTKTGELRVKRFSSIMREQVRKTMLDQLLNPHGNRSVQSYAALDNLYTTDAYSTIIQKGLNSPEYEQVLIKTLSKRLRLSNDDIKAANAYNEDPDHVKAQMKRLSDMPLVSNEARRAILASRDLRTIPTEWQKYVDREMTGIGTTMGASLFLGDDVAIKPNGALVAPNNRPYAETMLHKLPIFKYGKYDPIDRNIMAFNQAIRNVPLDKVNVAMMTLSGYTENDAAVVTEKYAHNHQIALPDGTKRDLKRGDKITDLHGNKSTISEIIDPNEKDPERQQKLAREIAIVKANPDLDVIINPYSSISRLNTGSIHEMQNNGITQLNNPQGYDIDLTHVSMGKEYYAVCLGQRVDEKTRVYTKEDFQTGQSRHFSHQLAAAAASADLPTTLKYVYNSKSNTGWAKFFDDLHVLGYDIDKQHQIGYLDYDAKDAIKMKMPTKEEIAEIAAKSPQERHKLQQSMFKDSFKSALAKSQKDGQNKPIIMTLQKPYKNMAGNITDKIVIPYNQVRADAELALSMGVQTNKTSSRTLNDMHRIYDYNCGIRQDVKPVYDENGKPVKTERGRIKTQRVYSPERATQLITNLSGRIKARDFGGDNIVKNDIYSVSMPDSATAVLTPDPNLDLDEVAVGPDIYKNLHLSYAQEGTALWRDPALRSGALRYFNVKMDKTLTGVAINPVNTKSLDADFDGDTVGLVPFHSAKAIQELEKQRPSHNLINKAAKSPKSYLETGLELQGSLYRQKDPTATNELDQPYVQPDTVRAIIKKGFQSDKAYGIGIDARTEESYLNSLSYFIESGAKGHCERDKNGVPLRDANNHIISKDLQQAQHYYDGERTAQDCHESMIGLSVKVDGVGPAGTIQQKLLWAGRDLNPTDVMDFTYLATQTILQSKHDGGKAREYIHDVLGPIPRVISGQRPEGNIDYQHPISTKEFEYYADDLYNQQLGLNVSDNTIKGVADIISDDKGHIINESKRTKNADLIDILAYKRGSVLSALDNAIAEDKKIASGRYTKCFSLPEDLCSNQVLGQYYKKEQKKQQKSDKHAELISQNKQAQTDKNAEEVAQSQQQEAAKSANKPNQVPSMSIKQDEGLDLM